MSRYSLHGGVSVALLWVAALLLAAPGGAVDFKCSACEALAAELQRNLDKEVPRNHLDMRHRLDGDGNRYGKMIPYKESELRVHDLLDDLCEEMTKYSLVKTTLPDESTTYAWTKLSGDGKVTIDPKLKPGKAEEKQQRKELESYCARTLDEIEEDLSAAIREGETENTAAKDIVCKILTKHCKKTPFAKSKRPDEL